LIAIRKVRVPDDGVAAVERDAALLAERRIAVQVDAIDDQLISDVGQLRLTGVAGAELNDVSPAFQVRLELEEHQRPVMRAEGGAQRR
jgi:hypothetical protein